jgi:hypothetical protein
VGLHAREPDLPAAGAAAQPWRDDTLAKVRRSWLFSGQARFADPHAGDARSETTPNGCIRLSLEVLHYSPEPRVIERAIESARYWYGSTRRCCCWRGTGAAFPRDYEAWRKAQKMPKLPER